MIDSVHKAGATNDFLQLLGPGKGHSPDARRFRDLYLYYKGLLGDRVELEHVRVQLLSLLQLTLQNERFTESVVAGTGGKLVQETGNPRIREGLTRVFLRDDIHSTIHTAAQIERLLRCLGLDRASLMKKKKGNGNEND